MRRTSKGSVNMAGKVKITQVRSSIKRQRAQKLTIRALGIRRMHQSVVHDDTPQIRGMIARVRHLISVEEM
jgi:large subunit ribosomal protein L30